MPAYFDTGFSVRQPMWHGLGNVLDRHPENWDEARLAAGLMWEPTTVPLYRQVEVPDSTPFGSHIDHTPLTNHQLVVRDDTQAPLGIVGDGYELVSHAVMGEIMEALSDEPNVKIETAGSCRGGAQVWALAYLDEPEQVAGDDSPTLPYLALLNSHDGTGACKVVATSVRVVCWNTYQAAAMEGRRTGRQFSFRHTASVHDRIGEAKLALRGVRTEHAKWVEMAEHLATLPAGDLELELFVSEFLPDPAEHAGKVVSDRVRDNVARNRTQLRTLYNQSRSTAGHRGSALGLVDAAVEYLDHLRPYRSPDTYMGRTMLRPEPFKAGVVKLAEAVCSAG